MDRVKIKDKEFEILLPSGKIQNAVKEMAEMMNVEFKGKNPLFISVLNGSFIFAADLLKKINIDCGISFVKLASYEGTATTGEIKTLVGLDENIKDRLVVILEDIVDTGNTIETLIAQLKAFKPAEVKIATLLFKPGAYEKDIKIDYIALEVPNDFLIGYGLDYDGLGRNYEEIYVLVKSGD
ncbi:MAG: hypoxanthine phosphoribosyltransferase [Bacteroidota bacterium]